MTGIVIITAGREDAYQDYLNSIKKGHDPSEVDTHIPDNQIEGLVDPETGKIHLWGTSVDSKWRAVEPGDVALVYREGSYVAQATVAETMEQLDLAKELWDIDHNRWDDDKPWKYLIFLVDVEKIDVGMTEFNELVGYDESYRPQGFSRVADHRIATLRDQFDSIETAINELTGVGVRIHEVDEESEDEDIVTPDSLGDRIVEASTDGSRAEEFENLVAKAFSRLGFESHWIEGGNDTDVIITDPITAVVDAKTRGKGKVISPNTTRILRHKERHDAEYAFIVAPGYTPAAIEDADSIQITLLTAKHLNELLSRREAYGLPPQIIAEFLVEPGAFQDDRLDQIDDEILDRLTGAEELLAVVRALERADPDEGTPRSIRLILKGRLDDDQMVPSIEVIEQSLNFLAHPSVRLADYDGDTYSLNTSTKDAIQVLRSFGDLIREVSSNRTD